MSKKLKVNLLLTFIIITFIATQNGNVAEAMELLNM